MAVPKLRFPGFTDDWEQRKLGNLCERVVRKNKNNESDLPLTIASQHGLIDQRDFFNKIVAAKDMSNYYLLKKGEFAYNKSYSKGFDYGSIKRLNAYEQGCLSTLYICFEITSDDVESDYLEYFFDTLKWYSDITMICTEGARNHGLLNVDTKAFFDEVTISMPLSKKEQRIISAYLNNLDTLIALHQRKCDELQELKKSLLQKMFPKAGEKVPEIRFPGFTDDWEENTLDSICDMYQPKTISSKEFIEDGKFLVFGANGFIGKYNNYNHETDQVCISCRGANCGSVNYVKSPVWITGNSMVCNIDNNLNIEKGFFYYTVAKSDFSQIITGGAQPQITREKLAKLKITKPLNMMEQQKIGSFFKELDVRIELQEQLLDEIKEYKKGLLQQMFC